MPGDIGAPETWGGRCIIERVSGATVPRVVAPDLAPETVALFIAAASRLESAGADVIVTTCGFLWPAARQIAGAVSVPTVVSALEALPRLRRQAGSERPIGILTFDSRVLLQSPLERLDPGPLVVEGIESGSELHRVIAQDLERLDREGAEADVAAAARRLRDCAPDMAAVVLECTNLPPYRAALEPILGVPVIDAATLVYDFIDNMTINR